MKIAVIGAGNMGGAIAAGAIRGGIVKATDLTIADPRPALAESLRGEGIEVGYTTDNREAARGADMIVVAVKPWLMEEVIGQIADVIDRTRQYIVSIAAGVTFGQLDQWLRSEAFGGTGVYRVIPNTAISIGRSVTFIASHNTTTGQDAEVMRLFKALGEVFEVAESKMTAVTALSSSGIAYAYKYLDAASRGGEQLDIDRQEALKIVIATMKGAIAMLESNGSQPQQEIDKVTTPGGVTLKGLEEMERCGFTHAVINGLLATK